MHGSRASSFPLSVGLSLFVAGLPCQLSCHSAGKGEAASLVAAVDAYRHAAPPAKEQRGHHVSEIACSDAKVCDAKAACLSAIDPTVRAMVLKDEVQARIGDIERGALPKDSPEALALPGKLDEAERLLGEGRAKMSECDLKLARLSVDFGV